MSNENETIIPWYLRVAFAPLMLISNVGDWWQERRARKSK